MDTRQPDQAALDTAAPPAGTEIRRANRLETWHTKKTRTKKKKRQPDPRPSLQLPINATLRVARRL